MPNLTYIEGIGETFARKLQEAGITTTETLLEQGATSQGRRMIAEKSGITETLILKWVNHADLYRIRGIGSEYADLLEASGVDTVPELAQRIPGNLYERMLEINQEKNLVRQPPSQSAVSDWIEQAKQMPRVISH